MQPNYIRLLLNLEDIKIFKITHSDTCVNIFIETTPKPHICPCCGNSTKRIHDYRMQKIKDLPFQLKNTYLVL
ncbi:zinc-finger of transposase IS204/IS1001/IS1096/IS1165, partial [Anaerocolumna aminovalerica]